MKLPWIVLAVALAGLLVFSFLPAAGLEAPAATARDATVTAGRDLAGDFATSGRHVSLETRVPGDVAVAGRSVTLAEPVEGYVMAAGGRVTIDGAVGNDLWAAGRDVRVSAPVTDNVWLAGGRVVLEPSARVGGDASIAGGTVEVHAPVGGALTLAAGEVELAGEIAGPVRAYTDRLRVLPGAVIHGDLLVEGAAAPDVSPDAQVGGAVQHVARAGDGWRPGAWIQASMFVFLALLLLGGAVLALSTRWAAGVAGRIVRQPGRVLVTGLLALLLTPVVIAALLLSRVGLPLAFVVLALLLAAAVLAGGFVALWAGGAGPARGRPLWRLVAGSLVLALLLTLPWVGPVVAAFVVVIGLGALLLDRGSSWRDGRQTDAPVAP